MKNCDANSTVSNDIKLLHQGIEDLRDRTKPRSPQTDKRISQLKDEGIEILNSQLKEQSLGVWFWCRTQAALEHIQRLFESNQLEDILSGFRNIQSSTSGDRSIKISIDREQFKKTVGKFFEHIRCARC